MAIRESSYGYWSGGTGFVLVAAGAAIGIGNITRLPYLASQYGGGAFVLVFLLAVLVMGWPLLVSEMLLGRWARLDVVGGIGRLAAASGARRGWHLGGWLMLVTAALILSYISVVAGWTLSYTLRSAAGALNGVDGEALRQGFLYLAQDPERSLAWHTMFMVMACVIVGQGVRDGIERAARLLMAGAVVAVLTLLWFAIKRDGIEPALTMVLAFRFGDLGWRGVMEALFQAFYTVGIGAGAMFAISSYLPASVSLPKVAGWVITSTLIFSGLGSLAVFGIILGSGQPPAPGLALIFQALPLALPDGWAGIWPAVLFYGALTAVAMASAVALLESVTLFLMERARTTRVFAATSSAVLIWFLGLGTLLSFNVLEEVHLYGRTFFEWVQWATARLLAPMTALLICVFSARIMPPGLVAEAWGEEPGMSFRAWRALLLYPARIGLIVLLFYCLGVIEAAASLWQS